MSTIRGWLRPKRETPTPEDVKAAEEGARIRYEMDNIRTSLRSNAGENYQSGRGSRP